MTRRTRILAAAAVAAVLIGGYTRYWFYVAGQLDRGIDDWAAQQRQAGLTLDFERTPVTGFPFSFRSTFRHPHIAGAPNGQSFDWHGPDVEVSVSPFNLFAINLKAPGRHSLDLGQGPAVLDAGDLIVRWGSTGNGAQFSIASDFVDAQLTMPDHRGFAVGSGTASVDLPLTPPSTDKDPLLRFALKLADLRLPQGTMLLTAEPLSEAQIAGTIKGPMPAAPLRQALAGWRDSGGTMDITSFAAAQAPLSLSGTATVALDQELQPIVAADVKARGLAPTIDLLASQHRIYPEDALKMKLFVKGAERDVPGGYKEVATGLTLQGGFLSWGPFKLAQVPPVQWP